MLLGVLPHVALQAIHICGGEVTHATSEETTTSDCSDHSLLALLQTPAAPRQQRCLERLQLRTNHICRTPRYDINHWGSENLRQPKKACTFQQASPGSQIVLLPEISLEPSPDVGKQH